MDDVGAARQMRREAARRHARVGHVECYACATASLSSGGHGVGPRGHNTHNPAQYACLFPAAIEDWRAQFADPSAFFVQIGPSSSGAADRYGNRNDSYGVPLLSVRHAQLSALRLPATGMATATDLGDPGWRRA